MGYQLKKHPVCAISCGSFFFCVTDCDSIFSSGSIFSVTAPGGIPLCAFPSFMPQGGTTICLKYRVWQIFGYFVCVCVSARMCVSVCLRHFGNTAMKWLKNLVLQLIYKFALHTNNDVNFFDFHCEEWLEWCIKSPVQLMVLSVLRITYYLKSEHPIFPRCIFAHCMFVKCIFPTVFLQIVFFQTVFFQTVFIEVYPAYASSKLCTLSYNVND